MNHLKQKEFCFRIDDQTEKMESRKVVAAAAASVSAQVESKNQR